MRYIGKFSCTRILLAAFAVICLSASPTHAQSIAVAKFTLQFEVQWGRATLPAGDYELRLTSGSNLLGEVYAIQCQVSAFVSPITLDQPDGRRIGDSLLLEQHGGHWDVRQLRLKSVGVLVYAIGTHHKTKEAKEAHLTREISVRAAD